MLDFHSDAMAIPGYNRIWQPKCGDELEIPTKERNLSKTWEETTKYCMNEEIQQL